MASVDDTGTQGRSNCIVTMRTKQEAMDDAAFLEQPFDSTQPDMQLPEQPAISQNAVAAGIDVELDSSADQVLSQMKQRVQTHKEKKARGRPKKPKSRSRKLLLSSAKYVRSKRNKASFMQKMQIDTDYYASLISAHGHDQLQQKDLSDGVASGSALKLLDDYDDGGTQEQDWSDYVSTKFGPCRLLYSNELGTKRLELDGRLYRHDHTNPNGVVRWRCAVDFCKGRVKCTQYEPFNTIQMINSNHNHGKEITSGGRLSRQQYKATPGCGPKKLTHFKQPDDMCINESHTGIATLGFKEDYSNTADGPNMQLVEMIRKMKEKEDTGKAEPAKKHRARRVSTKKCPQPQAHPSVQYAPVHHSNLKATDADKQDLEIQILREKLATVNEQRRLVLEQRYNVRLKKIQLIKTLQTMDPAMDIPPPDFMNIPVKPKAIDFVQYKSK